MNPARIFMPDYEKLHEHLRYDPESGFLYWKTSHARNVKAGSIAGHLETNGYWRIGFDNKHYMLHRIIWFMYYKQDPGLLVIDHIDRNPSNNKIANLRACSQWANQMNRKTPKNNKSGHVGVWYVQAKKIWMAGISIKGRHKHLGNFKNFEDALAARKDAEQKIWSSCQFEFNLNL